MPQTLMGSLAVGVTILGFILFLLVIVFLLRGDKLPKDDGNPHRIKYGALEVGTDRVVMLCLVFGLMTVLPLVGLFILQDREDARKGNTGTSSCEEFKKAAEEAKQKLAGMMNTNLSIVATIDRRDRGTPRKKLVAEVVRLIDNKPEKVACARAPVNRNGNYLCNLTFNELFRNSFALTDTFEIRVLDADAPPNKTIYTDVFTPTSYGFIVQDSPENKP